MKFINNKKALTILWIVLGSLFLLAGIINCCIWGLTIAKILSIVLGVLSALTYGFIAFLTFKSDDSNIERKELEDCMFKRKVDTVFGILSTVNSFVFSISTVAALVLVSIIQATVSTGRAYIAGEVMLYVGFGLSIITPIIFNLVNLAITYFKEKDYLAIEQAQDIDRIANK